MGFWSAVQDTARQREAMEREAAFSWVVVAVRLEPGGIIQEVVERFTNKQAAERWWEATRSAREYCVDFYVAANDERLKRSLNSEARVARR